MGDIIGHRDSNSQVHRGLALHKVAGSRVEVEIHIEAHHIYIPGIKISVQIHTQWAQWTISMLNS